MRLLTEYLRGVLTRAADRPTPEELADRIRVRGPVDRDEPSDVSVRRLRKRGE